MSAHETVTLITGGAQGIGKGIAKYLLEHGNQVIIADVDEEAGQETVNDYHAMGSIYFVRMNVVDEASVQQAVAKTIEHYGRLDALVNNAGIANPANAPVENLTIDAWNKVIATNLTGYFLCTKYAVPHLRQTRGAIVNIASTRALQSEAHTEAYAASKGGVAALTHALAISLGPEIRVNCISPGWIEVRDWKKQAMRQTPEHSRLDREQHPVGRVGVPNDIAAMVALLISDEAGFITGQNIVIDGGMTKKMIYAE